MFLRRAAIVLLATVLILSGIAAFLAWKERGRYYSDPAAPRQNESYDRLFAPNPPLAKPDKMFANVSVERTNGQITIGTPFSANQSEAVYPNLKLHRAAATNQMNVEGGMISLATIASGYATPRTNFDYTIEIPASFYSADLKPLPEEQITNLMSVWERKLEFRGEFPAAKFILAHTNLGDLKLLTYQVFDSRTKQSLTSGGSSSFSSNTFWFASDIHLWHQTPLEIVATVAVGPAEVHSLKPEENAELDFFGGHLKLVAALEGEAGGWSTTSDGKTNITRMRPTKALTPYGAKASFLFLVWPKAANLPLNFEFRGTNDAILPGYSSSTSDQLLKISIRAELEEVKEIRAKAYAKVHRLVFTIPELPGLPEENRDTKNLFDVHIPYIRFANEWEFQSAIGELTGMAMTPVTLNPTNIYYPLIYTNTTTRVLFRNLSGFLANPQDELKADPVANKIEVRSPPWTVILAKLKRIFSGK